MSQLSIEYCTIEKKPYVLHIKQTLYYVAISQLGKTSEDLVGIDLL